MSPNRKRREGQLPIEGRERRTSEDGKERLTKRRSFPTQNRLEDPHERFGELVLEVVGCVDGDVVLEDVDGVFGLVVGGGT